jgi:hypothetical protein
MLRYLVCVIVICALCVSVMAQDNCEGGLVPRLVVDGYGRVTEGDANNVRDAANRQGNLIGQMAGGTPFEVLDGFECTDSLTWWQVEYFSEGEMITGWTAESNATDYFLEPILDENYFLFRNVSFILPESLASEINVEIGDVSDLPYINITFPDLEETAIEEGGTAGMNIFPTEPRDNGDDVETMWEGVFGGTVDAMDNILETRPDLTTYIVGSSHLPDLTPGAANITYAQRVYLDFGSGSGIRFLTAYAQDFFPVNNNNLRYRYQGLTDDGDHYLDIEFAVDAPQNPPLIGYNRAGTLEQYYAYGEQAGAFYDTLAPETFTPSLLDLDAFIASIEIR